MSIDVKRKSRQHHNYLLREARVQIGWTQQELADHLGTTVLTITRWERGITYPRAYFQTKLCTLFCKTLEELGFTRQLEEKAEQSPTEKEQIIQISPHQVLDPALPFPSNANVPLVGRQDIMDQLIKMTIESEGTFVFTGLPGMGKTALMLALAHHPVIHQHFPQGILWAGLGREVSPIELLSRWGRLLGMPMAENALLTTSEDWANELHRHIRDRRLLLLIDDAWKLEEALIFRLGGIHCVHLVTTRFPPIAYAMAAPQHVTTLHELCEEESLLLMQYIAPSIVQAYLEDIKPLLRTLGGLPLAVQLIGRYIHIQGQMGSARRIRSAIQRLTWQVETRLLLSEPQVPWEYTSYLPAGIALSLQAAIAVSEQTLQDPAREALRALSIFSAKPNSFSEEAALAVCRVDAECLDQLVDGGLIEQLRFDRHQLHQTIADYARLQGVSREAEERFLSYFFSFVKTHALETEILEPELLNIDTAFTRAFELQKYPLFLEGVLAFAPFLVKRRFHEQATTLFAQAQEIAKSYQDQERLAWLWWYQGIMHELRSDFSEAENAYTQGLHFARQLDLRALIGRLLVCKGGALIGRGDTTRIEADLREGLMLVTEAQDNEYLGLALRYLGEFFDAIGDNQQANEHYAQALTYVRSGQNVEILCTVLQNMGVKASRRGDYQQATAYYQEALFQAKQIRHQQRECAILMNIGMLAFQQNRLDEAFSISQESLRLARLIRHKMWISAITQNLAIFERARGHYEQATTYLQESLELAELLGHRWLICETQIEYGLLLLKQLHFDTAKHHLEKMLAGARAIGAALLEARALFGLAQAVYKQQAYLQAKAYGEASLALFQRVDDTQYIVVAAWLNTLTDTGYT